jgi:hypothetical protein
MEHFTKRNLSEDIPVNEKGLWVGKDWQII